jgi:hypothetical protein
MTKQPNHSCKARGSRFGGQRLILHTFGERFMENAFICAYGILNQVRSCIVAPPCTITVTMTISDVVVNIACLASDIVLRIARAKDMAPRKPVRQKFKIIRITEFCTYCYYTENPCVSSVRSNTLYKVRSIKWRVKIVKLLTMYLYSFMMRGWY